MKKTLTISILALALSTTALVKCYMCCQKAAIAPTTQAVEQVDIAKFLSENPEAVVNALQSYEAKMRDQAMAQSRENIKKFLPAVNDEATAPFTGPKDAKVTLVEFFDFSCGYCHRLHPELKKVIANNPDVKFVFRPLAFLSPMSEYAAKASFAADMQGKYQEFTTALMTAEERLTEELIDSLAGKAGVNAEQMKLDMQSDEVSKMMQANSELAGNVQVNGVPTMILNGDMLQTLSADEIQSKIDAAKAAQ